ncbi:MAG: hypothetical protein KTR20_14740 [Cellvibrionaceae bacterium]|nr:hypothetical protein [Cellvibrionaceae bacterium]
MKTASALITGALCTLIVVCVWMALPVDSGPARASSADLPADNYQRLSRRQTQVDLVYSIPCNALASHYFFNVDNTFYDPVTLVFAEGLAEPAEKYAVPGNRIRLQGYWVQRYHHRQPAYIYFEVYGWKMLSPYDIWDTKGARKTENITTPAEYKIAETHRVQRPTSSPKGC